MAQLPAAPSSARPRNRPKSRSEEEERRLHISAQVIHRLVRQGGFALITGEPGTGKSVALCLLADRLGHIEGLRVAAFTHPSSRLSDFYREMGEIFGISLVPHSSWGGFKMLRKRWLGHLEDTRMRPLLLIDEAQELLPSVFADVCPLASTDFDSRAILSVVFAGNPALMTKGLKDTLVAHAGGNFRSLTVMGDALLAAAAEKDREVLDEKLFIEAWGDATQPKRARR